MRALPLSCVLLAPLAAGQSLSLVRDINAAPVNAGSSIYPAASDPHGARPNEVQHFVTLGTLALFQADDGVNGVELWRSDGTVAGTWMVRDIYPGLASSYPQHLFAWNGAVYFSAGDGVNGFELWRSDGTTAGTTMVADLHPTDDGGPSDFAPVSPTLLAFRARVNVNYNITHTLWVTDGTAGGTVQVTTAASYCDPREITPLPGGGVVFASGINFTLWRSDGTASGTVQLSTASGPFSPGDLQRVGASVFFAARKNPDTTGAELWVTDGTAAGTVFVKDVLPGQNSGINLNVCAAWAGSLWFRGNDVATGGGDYQLWRSNGTAAGTVKVTTGLPFLWVLEPTPATLYLGTTAGVYASDGTNAGTTQLGPGDAHTLKWAAGKLWWRDNRSSAYDQLWASDGTAAGTVQIGVPGGGPGSGGLAAPDHFAGIAPGAILLKGWDGLVGDELWISNGTTAGTTLVRDIYGSTWTQASSPDAFCELRAGVTCFAADDGVNGKELWITDGTAAGTSLVLDIQPGSLSSSPSELERLGGTILFAADDGTTGQELWRTNGTAAGTTRVRDIALFGSSMPADLLRVGARVYFAATDDGFDRELWVTDGSAVNTARLRDLDPAGWGDPRDLAEVGYTGRFVFSASVGGDRELWVSDGTAAGTVLLRNISLAGSGSPQEMTRAGTKVVFAADDGVSGTELWITDGTAAGTLLLKDLVPGPGGSAPASFSANDDGRCAFVAYDASFNHELWITDGTAAGTVPVAGASNVQAQYVTWCGNRHVYFQGTDAAGSELWIARSFPAGAVGLLTDLNPGAANASPQATARSRATFQDSLGRLLLCADDGQQGAELWLVNQGAWCKAVDRPCGAAGMKPALSITPPIQMQTCTFTSTNAPIGAATVLLITFGPPVPIGLGGGCYAHYDASFFFLPPAIITSAPTWSNALPIPGDPLLTGLRFAVQAVYSVSFTSIDGWSNGVWFELGF